MPFRPYSYIIVTSLMTMSFVPSFRYLELGKPGTQKQEDFASLCKTLRDMRVNGAVLKATGAGKKSEAHDKGGCLRSATGCWQPPEAGHRVLETRNHARHNASLKGWTAVSFRLGEYLLRACLSHY